MTNSKLDLQTRAKKNSLLTANGILAKYNINKIKIKVPKILIK